MEGVEQTKVKHTTVDIYWGTPLNISLNINNEKQGCKIGSVEKVLVWGGGGMKEIKVRTYGWWTSYTYIK
jgi:hypothetical protein